MFKKCLWICILTLGIGNVVNAADMEAVLEGNTSATGFSVKDSNDNTLMRVQGDGNVGVGVTSPAEKLDVSGNVKATKFIGDGSGLTGITSGNEKFIDGTNVNDAVYTSGNVGIGTTVPSNALSVAGSIRANNEADKIKSANSYGALFGAKTSMTTDTGVIEIKHRLSNEGVLLVVSGNRSDVSSLERFVDLVLLISSANPMVISSVTRETPPNRSYSIASENLMLELNGGSSRTYNIYVTGIGGDESAF